VTATTTATAQQHDLGWSGWTARYTWHVPEGSKHPRQTEIEHGSERRAVEAAVSVLDNQDPLATLRVVRAEVKGPSGEWRKIEWTP
jgi:hypothetical protein